MEVWTKKCHPLKTDCLNEDGFFYRGLLVLDDADDEALEVGAFWEG